MFSFSHLLNELEQNLSQKFTLRHCYCKNKSKPGIKHICTPMFFINNVIHNIQKVEITQIVKINKNKNNPFMHSAFSFEFILGDSLSRNVSEGYSP